MADGKVRLDNILHVKTRKQFKFPVNNFTLQVVKIDQTYKSR